MPLPDALAQAQKSRQPVMLYLCSHDADQCATVETEVFSTPEFGRAAAGLLAVRVDGDAHPELFRQFDLEAVYPTVCFLEPAGRLMGRLVGVFSGADYMQAVRDATQAFDALRAGGLEGTPQQRLELGEYFYRLHCYDRAAEVSQGIAGPAAGNGEESELYRRARILGAMALRLDAAWRVGNFGAEDVTGRSIDLLNGVLSDARARDATREEAEALSARVVQYRPIVFETSGERGAAGGGQIGILYNIIDPDAVVELIEGADEAARQGPAPRPGQTVREKLRLARTYIRLVNRARALPYCQQLAAETSLSPTERAEVLANLGWGLLEKGENDRARDVFDRFLREFDAPSKGGHFRPEVLISLSALAYSEGQDAQAIDRLVDVVQEYKGTTWADQAYDLLSRIAPDRYPPAQGPISAERRGG